MKIAYVLAQFPAPSETFVRREIECLARFGKEVIVLAARRPARSGSEASGIQVFYRPARFSVEAARGVAYLLFRYPLSLFALPIMALKVAMECPREGLSLLANIHTVGCFTRRLDASGIKDLHACFLSWPACIGLALSRIGKRRLSIAAHARDIFVEPGALKQKVAAARFVVVCTRQGLKQLRNLLPSELHGRLCLSRHGIDTRRWHPGSGGPPGQVGRKQENPMITTVGRMVPKKGFGHLIRAVALLKDSGVACRLVIVGD